MRMLNNDPINPVAENLMVTVLDEPAAGNAPCVYEIGGYNASLNASWKMAYQSTILMFQNGPVTHAGFNGITREALLSILIDQMECFQKGPFACAENAEAMKHMIVAREALYKRTRDRMARGVEGSMQV